MFNFSDVLHRKEHQLVLYENVKYMDARVI